ncbi:hypothetical protein F383_23150 [Gossypium arboreum]|uniref:Uncharacterized protein n=1 Tax=Gossypium arboreum TaxID=29729 RepID=A0A0B0NUK5_GOSAR|nr:hypothetical protein F383_23150 [Gossypium arboreum]
MSHMAKNTPMSQALWTFKMGHIVVFQPVSYLV